MIDRSRVEKCLGVMDQLSEESVDLTIQETGDMSLVVYPKNWWSDAVQWTDEKRHGVLALLTPLVGRLDKKVDGTTIGYTGEKDGISIRINYADKCKIVGYKTTTKTVRKEIERPTEFEEVEEEVRVPITDCDIRSGKFSKDDIEVPA